MRALGALGFELRVQGLGRLTFSLLGSGMLYNSPQAQDVSDDFMLSPTREVKSPSTLKPKPPALKPSTLNPQP